MIGSRWLWIACGMAIGMLAGRGERAVAAPSVRQRLVLSEVNTPVVRRLPGYGWAVSVASHRNHPSSVARASSGRDCGSSRGWRIGFVGSSRLLSLGGEAGVLVNDLGGDFIAGVVPRCSGVSVTRQGDLLVDDFRQPIHVQRWRYGRR